MSKVQHHVSANKLDFEIAEALKSYASEDFMSGVDSMDTDKNIGGSFTSCAMFKT